MILASNRTSQFQYAIRDVAAAAEAVERSGRQVIRLNIGDPQAFGFRPPEHVIEAVERAMNDRFTGYAHSTGLPDAKEAIAKYAFDLGTSTTAESVIITAGASEGADLVMTALLNPGDEILLPSPGYPLYTAIANKLGAVTRYYRLDETRNWQPSTGEVAALISPQTKAIVLINPNNPTGAVTADATTKAILELAERNDLVVIADEVYRDLCFVTPPTAASVFAEEIGTPVITLESLSKTHMLSGWRIGWMRFTHADRMTELIGAITRLASGRLCSPTPAQYAVRPALEGDKRFIDGFIADTRRRRDFAVERVAAIEGLSSSTPDAAFYLMVKADNLDGRTDAQFVLEMLEKTGVLVVPGSGFGSAGHEGYFRLVYLADEQILGAAFDEIGKFITNKRNLPANFGSSLENSVRVS